MDNNYKFIDEENNIIYKVISPNRVIPEKEQHVIVRGEEYSVLRVNEIIDFDKFKREITIYLNNLE